MPEIKDKALLDYLKSEVGKVLGLSCDNFAFSKSGKGNLIISQNGQDIYLLNKRDSWLYSLPKHEQIICLPDAANKLLVPPDTNTEMEDVCARLQKHLNENLVIPEINEYFVCNERGHTITVTFKSSNKDIGFSPVNVKFKETWSEKTFFHSVSSMILIAVQKVFLSELLRKKIQKSLDALKNTYVVPAEFLPYLPSIFQYFCGKSAGDVSISAILKKDNLSFLFYNESFLYNLNNGDLKFLNEDPYLAKVKFIQRNKRKLIPIVHQIKRCKKHHLTIGNGKITFSAQIGKRKIKLTQKEGSLSARQIQSVISDVQKAAEKEEKAYAASIEKAVKSYRYYGDLTAICILECIRTNEKYITENAVVKNLRGMNNTTKLVDSYGSGRLQFICDKEIKNIISELIFDGVLVAKSIRGAYGSFETIRLGEKVQYLLDRPKLTKGSFNESTDIYWFRALKYKKDVPAAKQLNLFDHKAVVCLFPELVKEYLTDCPKSWKEYIRFMYSVETGTERKYWNYILSLMG